MKPIDLLIYDLDGTLIDSSADITSAANAMLTEIGLAPKSREAVIRCVGRGVQSLIRSLLGPEHLAKFEAGLAVFRRYYSDHLLDQTVLYPDVFEVLNYFHHRAKKQAVISNKPKGYSDQITEGLGIRHFFSVLLGGDSVNTKKPSPEAVFRVLGELKIPPAGALLVGDSKTDIEAGKNAGVATCAVTYGFGETDELERAAPDFSAAGLRDLISMVVS